MFENPEKGATDFNDLHVREGLDAVRRQLLSTEAAQTSGGLDNQSVNLSIIDPKSSNPSGHDLARAYIGARRLICDGILRFRYYRGDHFRHRQNRYVKIPQFDLKADVMAFLQSLEGKGAKPSVNVANNVFANIQAITLLPWDTVMPSFLNRTETKKEQFIPLKNGILDVEKLIAGEQNSLLSHTPQYFSVTCLPYDYDPERDCPRWHRFLNEMVPEDIQLFLQEWFGYNLVHDTSQQKFVILTGAGANGKTVALEVLRALLGSENVSAVGLEQFDPSRTFPLANTVGKLANIVGDLGELDEVAEGILKDFVSGGVMTLEIKYKDPFEAAMTARLTFASNQLPAFRDMSDGLWRRLIIVPFNRQILDVTKQDKNLTKSEWWEASGELPGIFNWAIDGLLRLRERGSFTEPKECQTLREEFKKESNWAARFLREHCVEQPGQSIASRVLYRAYVDFVKEHGERPLRESPFARELKKLYPPHKVFLTENPQRISDGSRSRLWIGLEWIDGHVPARDLP